MVLDIDVCMTLDEKIEYFNTVGKLTFNPKKDDLILNEPKLELKKKVEKKSEKKPKLK